VQFAESAGRSRISDSNNAKQRTAQWCATARSLRIPGDIADRNPQICWSALSAPCPIRKRVAADRRSGGRRRSPAEHKQPQITSIRGRCFVDELALIYAPNLSQPTTAPADDVQQRDQMSEAGGYQHWTRRSPPGRCDRCGIRVHLTSGTSATQAPLSRRVHKARYKQNGRTLPAICRFRLLFS